MRRIPDRSRATRRSLLSAVLGAMGAISAMGAPGGCSLATDTAIRAGIGKPCSADDDCAGAVCQKGAVLTEPEAGICSQPCKSDPDCLSGTVCATGFCQVPLTVGLTIPASPAPSDAWSSTFAEGVTRAAAALEYVRLDRDVSTGSSALDMLRGLAARNQVVVGPQLELLPNLAIAGTEYAGTTFLGVNAGSSYTLPDSPPNLGQAWLRSEEAWFIAGRLAARSAARRLGVISGLIGPESVRSVNAFTLGARAEKPGMLIEVRHIGYARDAGTAPSYSYAGEMYFREEYLARLLWEGGAEVIADLSHRNERARRLLQTLDAQRPVLSIIAHVAYGAGDLDPNIEKTVLAAVFLNWAPLHTLLFEQIHRGRFPDSGRTSLGIGEGEGAPFGVLVNRNSRSGLDRDDDAAFYTRDLVNGRELARQRIFSGPLRTTGQRDQNDDGVPDLIQEVAVTTSVSDEELARMCFYVEGVVEKRALNDPMSEDVPARVPGGLLPGSISMDSSVPLVAESIDRLALPVGQSASCRKNARWVYRSQ